MKKIGEGWQYSVYDLGNGRVLKRFHSFFRSYWVILKTIFPFKDDSIMMIPDFSRSMKRKALISFEILKHRNIPSGWLGNPRFINELDFEQDKAKPLHDVFTDSDTAMIKQIIDKFVVFNRQLMERGVIDKSFNITKNYGLNELGLEQSKIKPVENKTSQGSVSLPEVCSMKQEASKSLASR